MYFHILHILMALLLLFGLSQARLMSYEPQELGKVSKTIYVNPFGHGNFTTMQQAIDFVPSNNNEWIRIKLRKHSYNEKVIVLNDKTFILLEGENLEHTIIQWDEVGSGYQNATFAVLAENFVARNIQFRNSYNKPPQHWANGNFTWSTALHVGADKAAFFNCKFIGQQDTLNDHIGRHYFESCYIEGGLTLFGDMERQYIRFFSSFHWAKKYITDCEIFVNTKVIRPYQGAGCITAQGRDSQSDTSGFVFNSGSVFGSGPTYLGRAYRQYSRVLFHKTHMSYIVVPQGWGAWKFTDSVGTIEFGEEECSGEGSNKSKRVEWEKNFSPNYVNLLTNPATFIDQDGWLQAIPA